MDKVIKNFIYNTGYQILAIIIPIITIPYLSRVIGAAGMGEYSYANSIAYYFSMFIMLGLNNYGNRSIAEVRNDKILLSRTFWEIYSMQVILGMIVVVLYIIFVFLWGNGNVIQWLLIGYVFASVIDVNWLFFGLEKFRFTVIRNTTIKIISTACIFLIVKKDSDLILYILILVIGTLASVICLWPTVFRIIGFRKVKLNEIQKHIKPNLVLFIPIIAISLYKYMDKIMLGNMSVKIQVGYYEYSEKIIQIPLSLVNSLATVMLPRMSNLVATNRNEEEKKYISVSIILAMFLATSMCFGLMGIAKEFVPVFFGDGFDACIKLFYILLPSCCFVAFASVIRTQYLIPHKLDGIYIKSVVFGAIVNIVINFALIPKFAAAGAAVGTLLAEATVCLYQIKKVQKKIDIKSYLVYSVPFVAAGLCMFLVLAACDFYLKSALFTMLVKVIIGITIYFIMLFLLLLFNKKSFCEVRKILLHIKNYK